MSVVDKQQSKISGFSTAAILSLAEIEKLIVDDNNSSEDDIANSMHETLEQQKFKKTNKHKQQTAKKKHKDRSISNPPQELY